MSKELAGIIQIDSNILRDREIIYSVSIAARMAWTSDRSATRIEDRASFLMGMVDVNVPMLYGEGEDAFARLQKEINQQDADGSQHHRLASLGGLTPCIAHGTISSRLVLSAQYCQLVKTQRWGPSACEQESTYVSVCGKDSRESRSPTAILIVAMSTIPELKSPLFSVSFRKRERSLHEKSPVPYTLRADRNQEFRWQTLLFTEPR